MAQPNQTAATDASKNPFTETFGKYTNELLEKRHVPSVTLAVVDGDEIFTQVRI